MVLLIFFLKWRVQNPNGHAMWLWGMSVVCETCFAFSWLLDQKCETYIERNLNLPMQPIQPANLIFQELICLCRPQIQRKSHLLLLRILFFQSSPQIILLINYFVMSLTMAGRFLLSRPWKRQQVLLICGFHFVGSTTLT